MQNLIVTTPHELKTLILDVLKENQSLMQSKEELSLNAKETPKKFYSRKETAEILGITLATLHKYTKDGVIDSHRIGNRVLYKFQDIESALTNRKFWIRADNTVKLSLENVYCFDWLRQNMGCARWARI